MPRVNEQVAAALHELADLLEIQGEDPFRIVSYRRAANAIGSLARDVSTLSDRELEAIRGVGHSTALKVREFLQTGTIAKLEEARRNIPEGVRLLTRLGGIGPKRALLVHTELGVSSLEDLRRAAEQGQIRTVKGLGPKVEENILRALAEQGAEAQERVPLGKALVLAEAMLDELGSCPQVLRSSYAGSLRRMRETIGDVDLLAASEHPGEVMEAFCSLSPVSRVLAKGETKSSVLTTHGLQVDLRVVEPGSYGSALQYFTGSKDHNIKVREHAVKLGYKLSEYGVFEKRGGRKVAGETEEDVYARLGMPWIPPTLRENRGEVEAALAGQLPRLVEVADVRGDLHVHTRWSDGEGTVRDVALAAAERGYEYVAITDHARGPGVKGLGVEDVERQRREVERVRRALGDRIAVLHGIEANIGPEGELDYPDEVLARFDVVVASLHRDLDDDPGRLTRRVLRALQHPRVRVLAHPTGRVLGQRGGLELGWERIFREAAERGVAVEVNARPERLDLPDELILWARDFGVRFAISSDAHHPARLADVRYGVFMAQRGWVGPEEVVNAWPLERLRAFLSGS